MTAVTAALATAPLVTAPLATATALVMLAVGAGLGSVLRLWLLHRLTRHRVAGGVAWVNVPAAVVAGGAVSAFDGWPLAVVLAICGGLSTYSSLALELGVAIRDRDRAGIVTSARGVVLGLAAGLGAAVLVSAVAGGQPSP